MDDPARDEVRPVWQAQFVRPFPLRMRGEEIDGVNMVMVDADIAGCVDTWLKSSSDLDPIRIGVLRACLDDLRRAIPALSDPTEREYYEGLQTVAKAVLDAQHGGPA